MSYLIIMLLLITIAVAITSSYSHFIVAKGILMVVATNDHVKNKIIATPAMKQALKRVADKYAEEKWTWMPLSVIAAVLIIVLAITETTGDIHTMLLTLVFMTSMAALYGLLKKLYSDMSWISIIALEIVVIQTQFNIDQIRLHILTNQKAYDDFTDPNNEKWEPLVDKAFINFGSGYVGSKEQFASEMKIETLKIMNNDIAAAKDLIPSLVADITRINNQIASMRSNQK